MAEDNHALISELISRLLEQQLEIDPIQAQHILEATNNDIELAIRLYIEDAFVQRHQMLAPDADRARQDPQHAGGEHDQRNEPVAPNAPPRRRNGNPPHAPPPFEEQPPNLDPRDADDSSHSSNGSDGNQNENIGRGNENGNHGGNENANVSIQDYASISDEDDHTIYDKYLKRVKLHFEQKYSCGTQNSDSDVKRKNTYKQREIFVQCMDQLKESSDGEEVLEQLMTLSKRIDHEDHAEQSSTTGQRDLVNCPSDYDIHFTDSSGMNTESSDPRYDVFKKDSIDELLREGLNLLPSDVCDPSRVLWGGSQEHEPSKDVDEIAASKLEESAPNNHHRVEGQGKNLDESKSSLKHSEDPCEDGSKMDGNSECSFDDDSSSESVKIPRTWIAAGFSLSPCGTGLALSKPNETELARLKSIQPTLFPSGTSSISLPLPPFHCGGITQLTSLVTALLYSGACLQGRSVKCSDVDRKPFDSLTLDEKKKEFPSRLAEALTAILWVASESGRKNRLNAVECVEHRYANKRKRKKPSQEVERSIDTHLDHHDEIRRISHSHDNGGNQQLIANRLKLCPVCRWDSLGQTSSDWNPLDEEILSTSVSLTNPNDLRAFVVSSLRNFMGVGGIALFLETLVHIQGLKNIKRMLSNLNLKKKDVNARTVPLISCHCEEKLQKQWADYVSKKTIGPDKSCDWSSPVCHDCVGPELISLLLTGRPYNSFEDWSAEMFGIGFLSGEKVNQKGRINPRLMRPCKPIWIVKGKKSYFVIWKKPSISENYKRKTMEDESSSFVISSWNSWHNPGTMNSDVRVVPTTRKESTSRIPFASLLSSSEAIRSTNESISEDDISNTKSHPNDMIHYDDFRRWRYQVPNIKSNNASEKTSDMKWIPFFRLNPHQKEIVKRKYSSCRDIAIWSLWPGASIDDRVGKSCITEK